MGWATIPLPGDGDNMVNRPRWEPSADEALGRAYINAGQYFDKMPLGAWEFYIGGYQPAQKWLKDRKGRKLGFSGAAHYQKIIAILKKTGEIMKKIDGY
jgi:hypothetical protein